MHYYCTLYFATNSNIYSNLRRYSPMLNVAIATISVDDCIDFVVGVRNTCHTLSYRYQPWPVLRPKWPWATRTSVKVLNLSPPTYRLFASSLSPFASKCSCSTLHPTSSPTNVQTQVWIKHGQVNVYVSNRLYLDTRQQWNCFLYAGLERKWNNKTQTMTKAYAVQYNTHLRKNVVLQDASEMNKD